MESLKMMYVAMSVMLGFFLYKVLSRTKALRDQIAAATTPPVASPAAPLTATPLAAPTPLTPSVPSLIRLPLTSLTLSPVSLSLDSELATSEQNPALTVKRSDHSLRAKIEDLDEKILAYLGSNPMEGLCAQDLSSIISESAGLDVDRRYINKHIINSRLYTMMRKKKVRHKYIKEGLYWYTE
jgi:hypothetical protein